MPGTDALAVTTVEGLLSEFTSISFIVSSEPASAIRGTGSGSSKGSVTSPSFGPKDDSSILTVFGNNLNATIGGAKYCLIGYDYVFSHDITHTSVKCIAPPSLYTGKVKVRLATSDRDTLPGVAYFEYIEDPLLFDAQPSVGFVGSQLLIRGRGFSRMPFLACMLGDTVAATVVISDNLVMCDVPAMEAGSYTVSLQTNGQHLLKSGNCDSRIFPPYFLIYCLTSRKLAATFIYRSLITLKIEKFCHIGLTFSLYDRTSLLSLWPFNGPSTSGSTVVTIYGFNFLDSTELSCTFGSYKVDAIFLSKDAVRCRTPPHAIGR